MGIEWYWSKGPCKVCTRCSCFEPSNKCFSNFCFVSYMFFMFFFFFCEFANVQSYFLKNGHFRMNKVWSTPKYSIYLLWQVQNNLGMYLSLFWHFHLYSHYERRRRRCGIRSMASVFTRHSPLCISSCFVFAARALVWWVFGDLFSILFYQYIWYSFQFSHERTLTRDSHILHPAQW